MGARGRTGSVDLARLRRRAAWVLWAECLFHALAPAGALFAAYLALALFGLGDCWMFLGVLLSGGVLLGFGLAGLRGPMPAAVDRRIEAASGLRHRPLAMLDDTPEDAEAPSVVLWQAHQSRMLVMLEGAGAGMPAPVAVARDRLALRGLLLLLLASGVIIAGPAAPTRLALGVALPAWPFAGPRVTAWITPPAYMSALPLVLAPGQQPIVLAGSRLTVIVDGPRSSPSGSLAGGRLTFEPLDDTSHRADNIINASGLLLVGPWWHRLGRWRFKIVAPAAPVIRLTGLDVTGNRVTLHWNVNDPYGLDQFGLMFVPRGYSGDLSEGFVLPVHTGDGTLAVDLADSPYGGLPLDIAFSARNLAGVPAGLVAHLALVLPGLSLHDPTALAISRSRQALALQPQNGLRIGNVLRQLAIAPPAAISDAADVQLAALAAALGLRAVSAQNAVDEMLALEKQIEAGPGYAASQALEASNQALTQALQGGLNGQAPDQARLQTLLQAMHEALARRFAAVPAAGGHAEPGLQNGQSVDMSALDRLAQQIASDEAAGDMAKAAAELRQLQHALSALQAATPMTPAQAAQAAAAQAASQAISRMTAGEASLLDATGQGDASPADQILLRQQLGQTEQGLGQAGIQLPGLGATGTAMRAAQQALAAGDIAAAQANEIAAVAGLQKAAAALAAAAARNLSIGEGGQPLPGMAPSGSGETGAPDEQSDPAFNFDGQNPARMIQQQIIKDDSDPSLPLPAHQYYHKLLAP